MKQQDSYNKLRGGYYTPDKIVDFILKWANIKSENTIKPNKEFNIIGNIYLNPFFIL